MVNSTSSVGIEPSVATRLSSSRQRNTDISDASFSWDASPAARVPSQDSGALHRGGMARARQNSVNLRQQSVTALLSTAGSTTTTPATHAPATPSAASASPPSTAASTASRASTASSKPSAGSTAAASASANLVPTNPVETPEQVAEDYFALQSLKDALRSAGINPDPLNLTIHADIERYPGGSYLNRFIQVDTPAGSAGLMTNLTALYPQIGVVDIQHMLAVSA